ncbi:ubiquitin-conjugating enzyme/RWD-like protein [Melanogaster broomeanus]|nr:ubiquitin-conjugating enzyme/RWD-like protein [Melanogaster broomeanus]
MASISARRLRKELNEIHAEGCPCGNRIHVLTSRPLTWQYLGIKLKRADDFETWIFSIEVLGESLYQGEVFTLMFRFDANYPISSPAVQFVVDQNTQAPIHPHVYSNGHICASILGTEWSPVLSVSAICVTLQSMLASCKVKERPVDNDRYVRTAPDNPKKTRFQY